VLDLLRSYDWSGNIREFENTVRAAMINAGDSNILLTNYFDIDVEKKERKTLPAIDKLIDEVFERKWQGEGRWNKFIKIYTPKGWQREILQKCIDRLKKNRQKDILRCRDMAELFGTTENNMRQRFHVLGLNWKEIKKS
jgi:transcriptional regulator with AAA-type ATPase domain